MAHLLFPSVWGYFQEMVLLCTTFLAPCTSGLCVRATRSRSNVLIVPSHPSYRVTWLPWLLRGSQRVSEVVTGLCLETFSRSMSGTESKCWSPEPGAGEGPSSGNLSVLDSVSQPWVHWDSRSLWSSVGGMTRACNWRSGMCKEAEGFEESLMCGCLPILPAISCRSCSSV